MRQPVTKFAVASYMISICSENPHLFKPRWAAFISKSLTRAPGRGMIRADMATLLKTLRLRDIYSLMVGAVIGSGVFLVPGTILRQVGGSVGLALLVWIAG